MSHETYASIDVHDVAAREDLPDVLAQTVDRLGLTNVKTGPVTRYPAKTGPDGYDEFWAANASGRDDKGMHVNVTVYYSPTPTTEHGETA